MSDTALVLVDHGPGEGAAAFAGLQGLVRADDAASVPDALRALDAARDRGLWAAGYASYELGYALEPRLAPLLPRDRRVPLLLFGLFGPPGSAEARLAEAARLAQGAGLTTPQPAWAPADHGAAVDRIRALIAAGDIYQANLTMPLRARWTGPPLGLFGALAALQPVRHAAFCDLGAGPVVLSRSPELFFRIDAAGVIETRPMKGTRPRDPDPAADRALHDALRQSEKDLAENLMIVDLLRNDLSRVAQPGSVGVPELFAVESFATVHQMSSRITAALVPGTGAGALLRALFPCGSVTGAPKIRAIEIIRALEPDPRGVYCGAIGWFAPDGRAAFNVAIRTLSLYPDGEAVLNVGGGIVHDSTPAGEWEEALWKARFAHLPERG